MEFGTTLFPDVTPAEKPAAPSAATPLLGAAT